MIGASVSTLPATVLGSGSAAAGPPSRPLARNPPAPSSTTSTEMTNSLVRDFFGGATTSTSGTLVTVTVAVGISGSGNGGDGGDGGDGRDGRTAGTAGPGRPLARRRRRAGGFGSLGGEDHDRHPPVAGAALGGRVGLQRPLVGVAGGGDLARGQAVLQQVPQHGGGPLRGQLPVRGVPRVADRQVVGVPLDHHLVGQALERRRDRVQDPRALRPQRRLPQVEQHAVGDDVDDQPALLLALELDGVGQPRLLQRGGDPRAQRVHRGRLTALGLRLGGRRRGHGLLGLQRSLQLVLEGLLARDDGVRRGRLAGAALEHPGAALQDGRLTEGVRQAVVQLVELLLVDLADREQHDEQHHEQGDHVGVGQQPALGVLVLLLGMGQLALASGHQAASAATPASPFRRCRRQDRAQLLLDQPRVGARLHGEDALEHHLHLGHLELAHPLELVGHRQPQRVGAEDTPQRGDEGAGDEVPELLGAAEVAEDVDQPDHRADDAQRGGVAAHVTEELDADLVVGPLGDDPRLEDLLDLLGVGAVHGELDALAQQRVLDVLDHLLEREQSLPAGLVGHGDDGLDGLLAVGRLAEEGLLRVPADGRQIADEAPGHGRTEGAHEDQAGADGRLLVAHCAARLLHHADGAFRQPSRGLAPCQTRSTAPSALSRTGPWP